jgi:hypothetical protein
MASVVAHLQQVEASTSLQFRQFLEAEGLKVTLIIIKPLRNIEERVYSVCYCMDVMSRKCIACQLLITYLLINYFILLF